MTNIDISNNQPENLPLFSTIKIQHIVADITAAIEKSKSLLEKQLKNTDQFTWDNLVNVLDESDDNLAKIWSPISHMNSVVSNNDLREAHDACLLLFSMYSTYLGQHEGLYQAYLNLANSNEFTNLNTAQQTVINNTLRDFRLSGIALSDDKKVRYGEISQQLSQLQSKFQNNVMDATLAWSKLISDKGELDGLPESALIAAKQMASEKDKDGYLFTLDFPSYLPVITYVKNTNLREEFYTAYVTRASEMGPNAGEFDNTAIIEEILALRHELALILDFANYADFSLATKMAETKDQVISFLTELGKKSVPQAHKEKQSIVDYSNETDGVDTPEPWDLSYYAEKLKQQRYAISDEILRPYFPENKVLSGLFSVVNRLFSINIDEVHNFDTWHTDVRLFNITNKQGKLIGRFYFDLYARKHKRGGAWMDVCRARRRQLNGDLQLPVAYLTCNFNKPVGDKPALFTHNEVITMFHEFGHGLHHMLTKVEVAGVSGINGVPWDAVELPSQFLENWCWEPDALALISGHVDTGEPLPTELLEKMLAAKNYNSALAMVRQLEFSLFDFILHYQYQPNVARQVQSVLDSVRKDVAVNKTPAFNRFQNSFGHIFAGGYAAGYYSYKWAEVLSADAFSKFELEGIFNPQTGERFLNAILEKGGSRPPMTLFKDFMGREPSIDALLKHSGIQ